MVVKMRELGVGGEGIGNGRMRELGVGLEG